MPKIRLTKEELTALCAVFTTAEQVDWEAYDRARTSIVKQCEELTNGSMNNSPKVLNDVAPK